MKWLVLFSASFVYIGLKSFQQLNVQHGKYLLIVPTSLLMAFAEVTVVVGVVKADSIWAAVPIGCGAGLGCMIAMMTHRRMVRK
jgi:Na+/melibiose symporter-like transporter